jgi:hypothetical protein
LRSATFLSGLIGAGISACVLSGGAAASSEGNEPSTQTLTQSKVIQTQGADVALGAPDTAFDTFLDRLMRSESNGISHAKNPRSSALGPFQFINSTFLAVMRQHFPGDIASLTERQILALRTNHDVARRAAKAFSKDNMAYLRERGITPTFGHLRLAFLLGPEGAARVLRAPPGRALVQVLEGGVISANPFMRGMTAAGLVARATRDVSPRPGEAEPRTIVAEAAPAPVLSAPAVKAEPRQPEPPARVAEADPGPAAATAEAPAGISAKAEAQPQADATAETTAQAEAQAQAAPKPAEATVAEATVPEARMASAEAKAAPRPGRITARRLDRPAVINVTCDSRLASCRRWIDQEVAKLVQVAGK